MNITHSIIVSLMVIAGMIASACASEAPFPNLKGTSWKLISYGPSGMQTPAEKGIETNLNFGRDGRVSGKLGCNNFSGVYTVFGDRVIFSSTLSTMMACSETLMLQESSAFQVMSGTVQFKIEGDLLTIYDASRANVITLSL